MRSDDELKPARGRTNLEELVERHPFLAWSKDTQGRFVAVNQAFVVACGRASVGEVLGKTDLDIWPRELAERYRKGDAEVMSSGLHKLVKEPISDAGQLKWFETFKTPLYDAEGRLLGTMGFARDVTPETLALRALKESERRQRALLAAIPDMLFRLGADGTVLDYVAPDERMLVVPPSLFIGKRLRDVLPLDFAEIHEKALARVLESGELYEYEYPLEVRGELRAFEARMVKSGPEEVFAIIRDVTDKKRADEALDAHDRRLQALIDAAPFGAHVYELHADGRLIFAGANRSADAILKLPNSQFLGKTCEEAFPVLRADLPDTYRRIAAHGGTYQEVHVDYEGGAIRGAFDIHAVQTGPNRMAVFFSDVSESQKAEHERKRLEAQFQQAQKMESLGQLAGGVAHDFNNLLSVILTYTGFVLDELPEGGSLHSDLTEVRAAAERAVGLTRQLLAFSRRQVIEPRDIDVNQAARALAKMLGRLIGENITLEIEIASVRPMIRVDPIQLDQAITNLAVNARDAMPDGGRLTLRTADLCVSTDGEAGHTGVTAGDYVTVTVSDTGTGIPDEILPLVFEPFFTTKAVDRGTGLGLPMVYGAMKQNGGHVAVSSEVGVGTSFTLYFPAAGAVLTQKQTPEGLSAFGHGETLLLVEDEAAVRTGMARMLRGAGYVVIEAASGAEALEVFERSGQDIALLVSDVIMPGMTGIELSHRLTKLRPGMKVLLATGYADQAHLREAASAGFALLSKPVERATLLRKVAELLAR